MPDHPDVRERRHLRTQEAADVLGLSPRTLEKYRCHGTGPVFRKLGGRVVYALEDLETWADGAACQSTSDPQYAVARAVGQVGRRKRRSDPAGQLR